MLFDVPTQRSAAVRSAVESLSKVDDETERGAIFTRRSVVDTILDLAGYTADGPLKSMRLLEPSFGAGDFLLPAVDRLLAAYKRSGGTPGFARTDLRDCIRAVEVHAATFKTTRECLVERLSVEGLSEEDASALAGGWLLQDDFLLTQVEGQFQVVVGNPPYVRQERIPNALLGEYRRRYRTIYDRADLYVPFFERCLDLLASGGSMGFICANRWTKNKYGGPLRAKIADDFHLKYFIDMAGTDAFHTEVIAYPAITVIERTTDRNFANKTRIAARPEVSVPSLQKLTSSLLNGGPESDDRISVVTGVANGRDPWLLDTPRQLRILRNLEAKFPKLEEVGARVGIGVATGADRVFIGDHDSLPVEDQRKLPLVMAPDIRDGKIRWGGKGVVNPFEDDGKLADLDVYPRFGAYIGDNAEVLAKRHVAKKNTNAWYRTIDRIYPGLMQRPKLLIPDIKGTATVAYDAGRFYPHHNLYYVTSDEWDLRALQTVLRSSVAVMFVAAYCVRMAGGFLRFQAQYLRRIRVPIWASVPTDLREALVAAAECPLQATVDAPVFKLYELGASEQVMVSTIAEAAQVRPVRERR